MNKLNKLTLELTIDGKDVKTVIKDEMILNCLSEVLNVNAYRLRRVTISDSMAMDVVCMVEPDQETGEEIYVQGWDPQSAINRLFN